ncbi:hypothetical protein ES319_A11G136500v1 [Gossypium barbadense]|uniref:Uncharacterized protein n=2 Tax=Gossypium TaxID=3633 RepID=A0A5J5TMF7_GOSBA|nr:hypothetical protein ES319_A11G136500v1 [Gossypium barbadense]TYG93876.1 hypothetical protein ES288_A11G145600v1 [Gossypium darwinii]
MYKSLNIRGLIQDRDLKCHAHVLRKECATFRLLIPTLILLQ